MRTLVTWFHLQQWLPHMKLHTLTVRCWISTTCCVSLSSCDSSCLRTSCHSVLFSVPPSCCLFSVVLNLNVDFMEHRLSWVFTDLRWINTHTQVYKHVQQVRADRWSQSGSSFSWIRWCVSSVVFPSAAGWLKLSLLILIGRALLSNGPLYWSSSEAFTVQSDVVCSVFTVSYSWGPVLQHVLDVLSVCVKQGCMFPLRTPLISTVTSADMAVGLCSLSNQPRDYWWGRTAPQNVCVLVSSHTNQKYRPMAASCYKADVTECIIAVHLQPSLWAFCAVVCASVWLLLMVETHCLLPEGSANISPTEDSESGLLSASFNNKPRRYWCCLSGMETVELWGGFLWFKMNDQTV